MEKFISFVVVLGFAAAMLLQCAAAQTVHVVGDSSGWVVPQGGAATYQTWAANNNFVVGDILMFNFVTEQHDVVQVPKESFDSCTSANPIGETITTGPTNITLSDAGNHYYICTIGQHCQLGQKLAITVSGSPGAAAPSTPMQPDSSSSGVFASFLVSLLSILAGFLF
ncbi:mavicyanin-like [Corylus avellana]|uniref:mavicyanin-like n=1 Tax=Corylus avellana TaxID=13451 RepID=UPI001E23B047|nr:mavicyanin-like [Corylus avellana]